MTRRLNGLKKVNREPNGWAQAVKLNDGSWTFWGPNKVDEKWVREVAYPNGGGFKTYEKGDRIWVKETWRHDDNGDAIYRADGDYLPYPWMRWNSPIFMPRWASRITLEIVDVRVQKLQEIIFSEIVKEGFANPKSVTTWARNEFQEYWNAIYKKKPEYQWEKNPWVWVIEFKQI